MSLLDAQPESLEERGVDQDYHTTVTTAELPSKLGSATTDNVI